MAAGETKTLDFTYAADSKWSMRESAKGMLQAFYEERGSALEVAPPVTK